MLYLHVIVNRGFPHVIWTEIWSSADNGVSWDHMGAAAKFPADLHDRHAQLWSWFDPDDGFYVVSTGFQRDKGIILRQFRPARIGDASRRARPGGGRSTGGRGASFPPHILDGETSWCVVALAGSGNGSWVLGSLLVVAILRSATERWASR